MRFTEYIKFDQCRTSLGSIIQEVRFHKTQRGVDVSGVLREPDARGVMIAARISPGERVAIERIARANDRTASREVRRAIRFYLGNLEQAGSYLGEMPTSDPEGSSER
jgi:hypothetical protein